VIVCTEPRRVDSKRNLRSAARLPRTPLRSAISIPSTREYSVPRRPTTRNVVREEPSSIAFSAFRPALKRKNALLQVLCLPLLRTLCCVTPFPATLTQTPGICVPRLLQFQCGPAANPICSPFVFMILQIPSPATLFFSHPYKTPGSVGVAVLFASVVPRARVPIASVSRLECADPRCLLSSPLFATDLGNGDGVGSRTKRLPRLNTRPNELCILS
jgi:hypothetical protein